MGRNSLLKVKNDYDDWQKKICIVSSKVALWVVIFSCVIWSIFSFLDLMNGFLKTFLGVVLIYSLLRILKIKFHKEGYIDGFQNGYEAGQLDERGVSEEIEDFCDELKIDERILDNGDS